MGEKHSFDGAEMKLTDEHKKKILRACKIKDIDIGPNKREALFEGIESACSFIGPRKYWSPDVGTAKMKKEIERLRQALSSISPNTGRALSECFRHSKSKHILEKYDSFEILSSALEHGEEHTFFGFGLSMINEVCESALKQERVIKKHARKNCRPVNYGIRRCIKILAIVFKKTTGRTASETVGGPFDSFLSTILEIVEPDQERTNLRKLIHSALTRDLFPMLTALSRENK